MLYALDAKTGDIDWSFDTVASDDLWANVLGELRRWCVVSARGRSQGRPRVLGRRQPGALPGYTRVPERCEPSRTQPLHRLDRRTQPQDGEAALVPPGGGPRHLRPGLRARVDRDDWQRRRRARRVVVGAGKGGQVLGMDPTTGKLLWKTSVGVQENHELTSLTGPTEVMPGTYGGVLTPPATADGVVYVATLNAPATLEPDQTAYFGGSIGTQDGEVVAVDAATGKHRWDTKVPGDPMGGRDCRQRPGAHRHLSGSSGRARSLGREDHRDDRRGQRHRGVAGGWWVTCCSYPPGRSVAPVR